MHLKNLSSYFLILFYFSAKSQTIPTEINPQMVFVKGGDFQMGSNNGKADERPVHTVTLKDYYIGKYEVTQSLWKQIMGTETTPKTDCPDCAVFDISFEDIQSFLTKLNAATGKHYRLPTEAEWEYAAAGGKESKGYKYSGSNNLDEVAWYAANADMKTHPVGLKKPNELGLYDMSGNVWELCSDWYQKSFYKNCPKENPEYTNKTSFRVVRGGSWRSGEQRCQVRARNRDIHDHHISNGGFRLVMEL